MTKRILIAEDEYVTAELFKHVVAKRLNHDVVGLAHTPQEAIDQARKLRPDIILLDIKMDGDSSGIDACRTIKSEMPEVKIFFLTAYSKDAIEKDLEGVNYDGFIDKLNFSEVVGDMIDGV